MKVLAVLMRAELCAPSYEKQAGGIKIEDKDDTKKRIGRSPDLGDAYRNRAALYLKHKEPDKAIADLSIFLQLNPESGIGYFNRSEAWSAKKDYKNALQDANQALNYGYPIDGNYVAALKKAVGE